MTGLYDQLESRAPQVREADAFSRLTDVLRGAICAPAYAHRLKDIDPEPITDLEKAWLACRSFGSPIRLTFKVRAGLSADW